MGRKGSFRSRSLIGSPPGRRDSAAVIQVNGITCENVWDGTDAALHSGRYGRNAFASGEAVLKKSEKGRDEMPRRAVSNPTLLAAVVQARRGARITSHVKRDVATTLRRRHHDVATWELDAPVSV